jgi:membrane-bound lytic murein transglycosylase B
MTLVMAGAAKDRLARRALVAALVAGAASTCAPLAWTGQSAAAQQLPEAAAAPETPPTAPAEGAGLLPGLDPRLVGVALEYGPTTADVRALNDASARLASLMAEQAALHARQGAIDARIVVLDEVQRRAVAELEAAESDRRRLTALVYSKGDTAWQAAALLQTDDAMDLQRVTQLGEDFSASLRAAMIRARIARRRATAEAAALAIERMTVGERLGAVEQVELPTASREVATLSVHAAASVAGGAVAGLGIPLATLDAYLRAEAIVTGERPDCGVRWWMLAGIGRVESNHGRFAGAQLVAYGDTAPHIVGIPLDGGEGVATIADSDAGMWDGDPAWDRAVGPMQFIPGTWRRYAADANGDGTQDPNNVYDAALGAAHYLCNAVGHLEDDASLTRAYLAYNHSDAYAASVLNLAREYQATGLQKPAG